MKHKERLDVVLVERGPCDSRSKAQALIMSGEVYGNGTCQANALFCGRTAAKHIVKNLL